MRRLASCLLLVSLLCGSGMPLNAEEEKETIQIYVHAADDVNVPCVHASYAVYEDAQASIPMKNAEGVPYRFVSDEKGSASLQIPEKKWYLRMEAPADGYYYDDAVMEGMNGMDVSEHKIRYVFSADTRTMDVEFYQEDGTVVEADQIVAGTSYTVREKETLPYHSAGSLLIDVPLMRDAEHDPICITMQDQLYGYADISFMAEGKAVNDVSFAVYSDEACTQTAKDIRGEDCIGISDEKGKKRFALAQGDWYLKVDDLPSGYCLSDTVISFHTVNESENAVSMMLEPMALQVQVIDILSGANVDAVLTCTQADGSTFDGSSIQAMRGHTYTIQAVPSSPGYFKIPTETVEIPLDADEQMHITLKAVPFKIETVGIDSESGERISVKYETCHPTGGSMDSIQAGDTVIFHETWIPDGYEASADQSLTIPSYSDIPITYQVKFTHVPFVYVSLMAVPGSAVVLYEDASCTVPAYDRYGGAAEGRTEGGVLALEMHNGTYYAKQERTSDAYWKDGSRYRIECLRIDALYTGITFQEKKAGFVLNSLSEEMGVAGVTYEILEEGTSIGTLVSTGRDLIQENIRIGHTYEVRAAKVPGQYAYTGTQTLTVGTDGVIPELSFIFIPYINLVLQGDMKTGIAGRLYTDETCMTEAVDLNGQTTERQITPKTSVLQMAPGTYWFKSNEQKHYYQTIVKIILDPSEPEKVQHITASPVQLIIAPSGEAGEIMELRKEDGTLLKTWVNDGSEQKIEADLLDAGENYTLQSKDSDEKVDIALPEQAPEEQPAVKLEKREEPIEKEKDIPHVIWMLGGAGTLIFCAGLGLYLHHRNENVFK